MPNANARANARTMPEDTPLPDDARLGPAAIAARLKFDAAYSGWLAARAASADPGGDDADEVRSKIYAAERAAQITLINTPAPVGWAVLQKLELVEHIITNDAEAGLPTYPLAIVALAAVRAD